jgi:hypothetical protein
VDSSSHSSRNFDWRVIVATLANDGNGLTRLCRLFAALLPCSDKPPGAPARSALVWLFIQLYECAALANKFGGKPCL